MRRLQRFAASGVRSPRWFRYDAWQKRLALERRQKERDELALKRDKERRRSVADNNRAIAARKAEEARA